MVEFALRMLPAAELSDQVRNSGVLGASSVEARRASAKPFAHPLPIFTRGQQQTTELAPQPRTCHRAVEVCDRRRQDRLDHFEIPNGYLETPFGASDVGVWAMQGVRTRNHEDQEGEWEEDWL